MNNETSIKIMHAVFEVESLQVKRSKCISIYSRQYARYTSKIKRKLEYIEKYVNKFISDNS